MDEVICAVLMEEQDAEISLSPGFPSGPTLPPGAEITWEDVYAHTAITYPNCYRTRLSGETLKQSLKMRPTTSSKPEPYYQQGADRVRAAGL
jgi:sulfur-oxidizing protein SoxB